MVVVVVCTGCWLLTSWLHFQMKMLFGNITLIFPARVSQILANVVFTPWLVFLLLTAALPSQSSALRCSATCNCSKQHFCVRKPQLPSKLCPRQLPLSFLHLNVEPERPMGADSPLASKHCDNQYFPKTTSILSPCLQTNRQRFWGPGWLVILRGWKKNYRMFDLHQSARVFLRSDLLMGVRTRHLLLHPSANAGTGNSSEVGKFMQL